MPSITRTFTREQLDTLGLPDDTVTPDQAAKYPNTAVELHREQIDTRRWESVHSLIFRAPDDGKAYRVYYREPLTEMQYSDAWNEENAVEAVEVEEYDRTVKAWRPVADRPAAAEPTVPRTEREYWQAIADALNAANRAGMPVGIDLDGTLTDHNAHSVVWNFEAERWDVAGYEDDDQTPAAQPTAPRVLTLDEYNTICLTAMTTAADAIRNTSENDAADLMDATLAAVGIFAPPPEPEPDTCPAQFAAPNGEWQQCTDEPGHDPANGHDNSEWQWDDGQRYATPDPAEAQQ